LFYQASVKPAGEAKKPSAPEADAAGRSGVTEEKEDEKDDTAAPRRRSRRET
jgi:calnexin